MKRAITWGIGALAIAGLALPAAAADLGARPITKAPAVAPVIPYSWTSCYIGANGGGKWSNWKTNEFLVGGVITPVGPSGFATNNNNNGTGMGGGQIGCQWQAGNWVFGIEGDGDATDLRRTFVAGPFAVAPFIPGDAITFKNDWQASVRGRIGYAWDRLLVYATGGVAFANVKATLLLVGFPAVSDSNTFTGGTVGAGIEYAILDNLSLGVEYRFSSFGRDTFGLGTAFGVFPAGFAFREGLDTNEVTARLNWHFNWWGTGAPLH